MIETPVRTNAPTEPRRPLAPRELSDLDCNVEITIKVGSGAVKSFTITSESDARNFLARLVPTSVIMGNTSELLPHISDSTHILFKHLGAEAIDQGLDLPENLLPLLR